MTLLETLPRPLADAAGLLLQIGDGGQSNFLSMAPGADVDHDHRVLPWPLPDESVLTLVASNACEYVEPLRFVAWMDEAWRVVRPGGQLAIVSPYAGSPAWWADPAVCNGLTEATSWFFDPEHSSGLWTRYRPRPWRQTRVTYHRQGNLEIVLERRP